jgi:hypothetical protein
VNAGIVDIFFGTDMALPATVDLNAPPSTFTPYNLFGAEAGDMFAYSMGLGDVDGDGVQDLIINAMGADGLGNPARLDRAGDAYVLSAVLVSAAAGQSPVTPTPTATPTVTGGLPTFTPTDIPACAGDCDGNGEVRVDEVVRAVAIALEEQPVSACEAGDRDRDGRIVINELVQAVNALLQGCPA